MNTDWIQQEALNKRKKPLLELVQIHILNANVNEDNEVKSVITGEMRIDYTAPEKYAAVIDNRETLSDLLFSDNHDAAVWALRMFPEYINIMCELLRASIPKSSGLISTKDRLYPSDISDLLLSGIARVSSKEIVETLRIRMSGNRPLAERSVQFKETLAKTPRKWVQVYGYTVGNRAACSCYVQDYKVVTKHGVQSGRQHKCAIHSSVINVLWDVEAEMFMSESGEAVVVKAWVS